MNIRKYLKNGSSTQNPQIVMKYLFLFNGSKGVWGLNVILGGSFLWQDEGHCTERPFCWHNTGRHLEVGMVQES